MKLHMPASFPGCTEDYVCGPAPFLPGEPVPVTLEQQDSGYGMSYNGDSVYLCARSRISPHYRIKRARIASFAGQPARRKPVRLKVAAGTLDNLRWTRWGEETTSAAGAMRSQRCPHGCAAQVRADQMLACGHAVFYERIRFRIKRVDGRWGRTQEIQRGSICPGSARDGW